jgi:UDP-GlcNAc:undecaprenyl-phosphate GlcNAc-1-phosphate transferase
MSKIYYTVIFILILFFLSPFGGTWFYLNNLRWLYILFLSFLLSNLLTPIVEKIGWKFKLLDYPSKRKIHKKPIPRVGGVAIFIAFIVTVFRNFRFPPEVLGVLIGATVLFLFEILDDIFNISAFVRLFGQILASIVLIVFGVSISLIPQIPGEKIIEYILTIIWVVGITNAMNFLDGVDGLSTGLTIISSVCFFIVAFSTKQVEFGYIVIALIGVSLGFLPYNFNPARIFLGDSGATLLGFLLASFAIVGTWNLANPVIGASIPILILGIPIFDMVYTTISRIRNHVIKNVKEWIEYTGKDHFHHRLLKIGLNQQQSVFFLYSLNFCLGIGAVVLRTAGGGLEGILLLLQAFIIFGIITTLMLAGREIS